MDALIFKTSGERPNNDYIVEPVCGQLRMKIRKSPIPDLAEPKFTFNFIFESICGVLTEGQYEQCIRLFEWISKHKTREKHRMFRPNGIEPYEDPLKYWKFILRSQFRERRQKQFAWSVEQLDQRRKRRIEYMGLWHEFIRKGKKSKRLEEMEKVLTVDDIGYFRSLAEAKVPQDQLPGIKKQSWWSGWWGSDKDDEILEREYGLSPAERKLFYQAIGYDEYEDLKNISLSTIPKEYVKQRISFQLKEFKIKLIAEDENNNTTSCIAEGELDNFMINTDLRSGSFSIFASLNSLEILDHFTVDPTLPVICQPLSKLLGVKSNRPLFSLQFDKNPLHSDDDIYLKVRLQGSDIVINIEWIRGVIDMFSRPFKKQKNVQVEQKIGKQYKAIKNSSVVQMNHLLETHKHIGLDINLVAPRLIIPEDQKKDAPILIVDLGTLSISTKKKERVEKINMDEKGRWQEHMYDQFRIDATSLQLLMINAKDWPLYPIESHPPSIQLLEKFDVSLSLDVLMCPSTDKLAKIRLSGYTDGIRFKLTGIQIRDLVRIALALSQDEGPGELLPELIPVPDEIDEPELGVGLRILEENDSKIETYPPTKAGENRKLIECHLSIAEGWLCCYREITGEALQPIGELHIEGLVIQYMFRSHDQKAYVGLRSAEIIDLMQQDGDEFKYLATSHPIKGQAGYETMQKPSRGDLISIIYTKEKKKSPNYAALDNQVDIAFKQLYGTFNRTTFAAIYELLILGFLSDGERKAIRKLERLKKYNALPENIDSNTYRPPVSNDEKLQPPLALLAKVTITFSSVQLLLNDNGVLFSNCSLSNMAIGVLYKESIMDIKGSLGGIMLEDMGDKTNYFPLLLSVDGSDTSIFFSYRQFTPAFADYPGFLRFLRLKVSSVKFTLIQRFFWELMDYFGEMSAIKQILRSTASRAVIAAQKESENLTNKEKYERKFRFEIMLEDFKFNIPKNSFSPEYIQIDMGKISLANNHFLIDPDKYIAGERMSFLMSDAHAEAGNALHPESLVQIIDNVDFLMEWERSIDDTEHLIPGFRLIVDVPLINFKMTEKQYGIWMNTIRQFITERSLQAQRRQILREENNDSHNNNNEDKKENSDDDNEDDEKNNENNVNNEYEQDTYVTVAVALNFHRGSVEIRDEIEDKPTEFKSQVIGELEEFAFVWISSSDGQMKMHFSFDDITVYDTNEESENKFSKLWKHDKCKGEPIFNLYYANDGKGHGRLGLEFDRPRMVMLPVVYKVFRFFGMNPYLNYELPKKLLLLINEGIPNDKRLPQDPQNNNNNQTNATANDSDTQIINSCYNTSKYEDVTIDTLFHSSSPPGFSMNFTIKDGVVKLPAKPEDANSSGIIFHGDFLMKYNSTDPINGFRIFLDNWQVNSCKLKDESNTMTRIIKPFNLSLSYLNTPISCKVGVYIDPIYVSFSYRDFKALMAIWSCLTPPDQVHIDDEDVAERHHIQQKQAEARSYAQQQILNLTSGGIKINLIDDLNGSNIPLLNAKIYGIALKMDNWSTALSLLFQCNCQSEYYNRVNTCWEPLIEPWGFICKLSKYPLPNTDPPTFFTKGTITSKEILNCNISKIFSDNMQTCVSSWTADYLSDDKESSDYYDAIQNISIRNETGIPLKYWYGKSKNSIELDNGCEKILHSQTNQVGCEFSDRELQIEKENQKDTITIQLDGGWSIIKYLPIYRVGSWSVGLNPKPANENVRLIWTVENKKSTNERCITVRSSVLLKNTTDTDIEIEIRIPHKGVTPIYIINSGNSFNVPLQYCYSGKIFIRPKSNNGEEFNWSTNYIDSLKIMAISLKTKKHILECQASNSKIWYCCWSMDITEAKGRQTIILYPPIQIENLLATSVRYAIKRKEDDFPLVSNTIGRGEILQFFRLPYKQAEISFTIDNFQSTKFECLDYSGTIEFKLIDKNNRELVLYMDNINEDITSTSVLYSKYWMINKTGLPLQYMRKTIGPHNHHDYAPGQIIENEKIDLSNDPSKWYNDNNQEKFSKPTMYSYRTNDIFGNETSVKIANSKWSKSFSLESVGTDGSLQIQDNSSNSKILFQLGVTIELHRGKYHRTKIITFRPRFIIVNRTDRNLYYRQVKTDFGMLISPGKCIPFHWLNKDKPSELCITFSPQHTWSNGFRIDDISEFAIKIKRKGEKANDCSSYLLRVEIQVQQATFFVILKPEAVDVPPYRIENETKLDFIYYQRVSKDSIPFKQEIRAGQKMPYTWDVPGDAHKLIVEASSNIFPFKGEYNLDKIKVYSPISFEIGTNLYRIVGEVVANGPTRILRLYDAQARAFQKEYSNHLAELEAEQDTEAAITLQLTFDLIGLGISIISDLPEELLYLSANDLWLDYSNSESQMRVEVRVKSLQIDNQLTSTHFPVLLCRNQFKGDPNADFFHFSMIKSNFYTSIDYFHYFSFLLQEMDLHIDDTIINSILKFLDLQLDNSNEDPYSQASENESLLNEPAESAKKLYFVLLHINPIKCNVTFCYSSRENNDESEEEKKRRDNPVQTILNAIGVTVGNIEQAPISLRSLLLENSFHTRKEIVSRILKHYYLQLLYEMYKVVGSFDIIGNPVSLVHNLGTGVYDFFYEPASGLVQSPRDFVLGVGKGSSSLVKNSVVGIFGTASKITGTLGKGVAHLTFDRDYVRERERHGREKPKHFGEGMVWGAKELTTGFKKGITGIITSPLDGAKKEGVGGFVKGMGKGVIGVAVKPGVGLFDMATRTTQGITNSAMNDKIIVRTRPARGFGPDKILRVYDIEKAIGQTILRTINNGEFDGEWHLYHGVSSNDCLIMLSNKSVLSINIVPTLSLIWNCNLSGKLKKQTNNILLFFFY